MMTVIMFAKMVGILMKMGFIMIRMDMMNKEGILTLIVENMFFPKKKKKFNMMKISRSNKTELVSVNSIPATKARKSGRIFQQASRDKLQ